MTTPGPEDFWRETGTIDEEPPTGGDPKPKGNRPPQAAPITLHWHGDPNDPEEKEDPLIAKIAPRVGKGLIAGQWGLYKTFTALDMAASVMTGHPFASHPVRRQGGVLFIAAEGSGSIRRRLKAIIQGKLKDLGPPDDTFVPVDLDQLPFVWTADFPSPRLPSLLTKNGPEALRDLAKTVAAEMRARFDLDLALIVIDTMAAASGMTDEDNAAEVQRLFGALEFVAKAVQTCVMGVDHFGKNVETGTRGSSAKESAADFVLALLGDRALSGAVRNARMGIRKLRDGDTGIEFPFRLSVVELGTDRWDEPITSGFITWEGAAKSSAKAAPKALRAFLRDLNTALLDHGQVMNPYGAEGSAIRVVDKDKVRDEFCRNHPAQESDTPKKQAAAKRQQWNRALKEAEAVEAVICREIGGIDYLWPHPALAPDPMAA